MSISSSSQGRQAAQWKLGGGGRHQQQAVTFGPVFVQWNAPWTWRTWSRNKAADLQLLASWAGWSDGAGRWSELGARVLGPSAMSAQSEVLNLHQAADTFPQFMLLTVGEVASAGRAAHSLVLFQIVAIYIVQPVMLSNHCAKKKKHS